MPEEKNLGSWGLTAEEFKCLWAAARGMTPGQFDADGRIVLPCDCGDSICRGWKSTRPEYEPPYPEPVERQAEETAGASHDVPEEKV